jgi:hypothetical protein
MTATQGYAWSDLELVAYTSEPVACIRNSRSGTHATAVSERELECNNGTIAANRSNPAIHKSDTGTQRSPWSAVIWVALPSRAASSFPHGSPGPTPVFEYPDIAHAGVEV